MSIEEMLSKGCFVAIDKPRGPPSAQVGTWVREILEAKKNGHIGTLDPKVSGVLLVGINKAVKFSKHLSHQDKEYVAIMHLHKLVPRSKIRQVVRSFIGRIKQKPPLRSAVAKKWRERTIYRIDILDIEGKNVLMRIRCEAGTYIRKLIYDMGKKLGVGANMLELRRTKSGGISEEKTVTLHELKDAYWLYKEKNNPKLLEKMLIPPERIVNLPKLIIKDSVMPSIAHGSPIYRKGIEELPKEVKENDPVVVYSRSGRFCGIAVVKNGPELYAKMDINWLDHKEFDKEWKKHRD